MRVFGMVMFLFLCTSSFAQTKTYTKKGDSDPKAKVILDKLKKTLEGYSSVEMRFVLTMELPKQNKEVQRGTLIQSQKKFVVKMDQQDVYCDGKSTWIHFKNNKQVQLTDYDEKSGGAFLSPTQLLNLYQTGEYVYTITQERTEKGNTIADIEFKPLDLNNEFAKMRLTVNKTLNKVVSLRVFAKDGSRYTLDLESLLPNKKYDPATFVFNAKDHPGVRIEDLRID